MSLIFKILLAALLHLMVFICYPETGPKGRLYLIISMLAWSVFLMFISANFRFFKIISGAAGILFNLALFALMFAAIAFTMPQSDRISVLEKIQNGRLPDRASMSAGLVKIGVKFERAGKTKLKDLDRGIQKNLKRVQKD
ncbi:MAG: hypothetical protein WCK75_10885 [Elusimicrobiota bacterium]